MNGISVFMKVVRKCAWLLLWVAGAVAALSSCTRNNGDIGPWFGTWQLTSITADGKEMTDYNGRIFWNFQNNIIMLSRLASERPGDHTVERRWGTWEETEGYVNVTFSGYDQLTGPDGAGWKYVPFPILHLPYDSPAPLRIVARKGHRMELEYAATDGVTYRYYLNKQS